MHGLQPVANVGQSAAHDHAHRVIEIAALHFIEDRDGLDIGRSAGRGPFVNNVGQWEGILDANRVAETLADSDGRRQLSERHKAGGIPPFLQSVREEIPPPAAIQATDPDKRRPDWSQYDKGERAAASPFAARAQAGTAPQAAENRRLPAGPRGPALHFRARFSRALAQAGSAGACVQRGPRGRGSRRQAWSRSTIRGPRRIQSRSIRS